MAQDTSLFSIARQLQRSDLFFFTNRTLGDLLWLEAGQSAQLLRRLEAAGLVARVERGKYLLLGLEAERVLSNPLFIASHLATPCYVSFWSALHYHGLTEQAPRETFVAVTRRKAGVQFRGLRFRFIQVAPHQFFGYQRELLGELPVVVADRSKALVDSLNWPRYAGGVGEVARALNNGRDEFDIPTLVEYANRMDSLSLNSRLGFLLERQGIESAGLSRAQGPISLDPGRPRNGRYDPRWRVYVNLPVEELVPTGVG